MTYIRAELRRLIFERAEGRCEYCRIPHNVTFMPQEIDHIYAEKHGGETTADNLCLSCYHCNRHKGSDLASLDAESEAIIRLFHPRRHIWIEHFSEIEGEIVGLTMIGRVTVQLLQMNGDERVEERRRLIVLGQWP